MREPRLSFESTYQLGDDPFDSVHPIVDERGDVVGACGLSATESSERPGRYYGFTAWLQDYANGQQLAAVGLIDHAAEAVKACALEEWQQRGTIDDLHAVRRGARIELATRNLSVRAAIADFDYASHTPGSVGYFGHLTVRFEVD